jgi:hypothetical protein
VFILYLIQQGLRYRSQTRLLSSDDALGRSRSRDDADTTNTTINAVINAAATSHPCIARVVTGPAALAMVGGDRTPVEGHPGRVGRRPKPPIWLATGWRLLRSDGESRRDRRAI